MNDGGLMNDFLYVYVRKYPFEYKPIEPVLEEKKWEIKTFFQEFNIK